MSNIYHDIIKPILRLSRLLPFYLFVNVRRFFCEKRINKIKDNDLLKNGIIKFNSENGRKLSEYLDDIVKNPENAENSKLGKI